jgi:hypothetical protein
MFFFGSTVYFIEMTLSSVKYKELIQEAVDNEDYLEAERLSVEYKSLKEIKFY